MLYLTPALSYQPTHQSMNADESDVLIATVVFTRLKFQLESEEKNYSKIELVTADRAISMS